MPLSQFCVFFYSVAYTHRMLRLALQIYFNFWRL
nr:MAG TPA: hypothetical protein [Caudoviricetes sp.]DAX08116.1 MAG TPA: hypothetical protein [Bacteriophage sp.]